MLYKVSDAYSTAHDRVRIRFDDPEIGIDWPSPAPILSSSTKDLKARRLRRAPRCRDERDSRAQRHELLVTGGAGFIGSAFIRRLFCDANSADHVVNLDKLTYAGNLGEPGERRG